MRVGGDRLISVNVRVIAATNQNLCLEVQKGRFREDLYFRLDVITVHIPPLRERIEDLPELVQELIRRCARNPRAKTLTIPERHLDRLMELHWPGNVRQLQNFVEKLLILCEDGYQDDTFEELYADLLNYSLIRGRETPSERLPLNRHVDGSPGEDEARVIRKALEESRFSRTLAAKRLGVSRTTLWRKLREMRMNLPTPGG
jgi:transcriptional regulator with PAS, ATPase and Fis domain